MAIINTSNGAMQAEVTDQQFAVVSAMLTEQRKSQDFIASCAMTALAAENAKLREALYALGRRDGEVAHVRGENLNWQNGSYLDSSGAPLPGDWKDDYQTGYADGWNKTESDYCEREAALEATK